MNRSQAFSAMVVLVAVIFHQASSRLPEPRTEPAQHTLLSSEAPATPPGADSVGLKGDARYKMQVTVDGVMLTFHAVDA